MRLLPTLSAFNAIHLYLLNLFFWYNYVKLWQSTINFSLISVLDQDAHCSKNDPLDWMFLMMGIRRCIASLVFFNFFFFLSVNMLAVVLSISWMLSGVQQSRDCYSHFWIEYPTISSMCPCNLTSHANSDQYAWAIPVLTYVLSRLTPWCGITLSATGSRFDNCLMDEITLKSRNQ